MQFQLYTGNKLEVLAGRFALLRNSVPRDPFETETVAVPTRGMATWLSQNLARTNGIAANIRFPFLGAFVAEILRKQLPEERFDAEAFSVAGMGWRIFHLLGSEQEQYPELANYLRNPDKPELRRYQLACRIAEVFDQYQLYRPELLLEWKNREPAHPVERWQARLWRALCRDGKKSRAELLLRFLNRTDVEDAPLGEINLFGIGAMPPVFLSFFAKVARRSTVRLFYLNPCREYWADQPVGKEQPELPGLSFDAPENPLLRAFALQGRAFFDAVMHLDGEVLALGDECFEDYPGTSALARLQQDVLDQAQRGTQAFPALPLEPGDDSITFHNCHGELRQVEILHDLILDEMQHKNTPPREIMVMAPDIARFAPCIRAVFDAGPLAGMYAICDRAMAQSNLHAEAFNAILRFVRGRFEASEFIELLEHPAIRKHCALGNDAPARVRDLLEEARIRWGLDGAMRAEFLDISMESCTWRRGLDRMLLGLALEDDSENPGPLAALPPVALAGGDDATTLLGTLSALIGRLAALRERLARPHPPEGWREILEKVLEDFFVADNESGTELAVLRKLFREFSAGAERSGCSEPLSFDLIACILEQSLRTTGPNEPFLRGKITFCSLVPMRSIPAQVIAILGMDDGMFPRRDPQTGFNLLATRVRPGDRSRAWEDRYLFLEALLAARRKFILLFQGQSNREHENFPPAIPVSELMEALNRTFLPTEAGTPSERLSRKHKLQAFASEYFSNGSGLFSYSAENSLVARQSEETRVSTLPRFRDNLEVPEEADSTFFSLRDVERYFTDACTVFLEEQLLFSNGFRNMDTKEIQDCETLRLDAGERYHLRLRIGERQAREEIGEQLKKRFIARLEAEDLLPTGALGEQYFDALQRESILSDNAFRAAFAAQTPCLIEIPLSGGRRITGSLSAAPDGSGLVRCRFTGLKPKDFIRFYLQHLALAASGGNTPRSILLGRTDDPPETLAGIGKTEACARWEELLDIYRLGRRRPLPILPEAATAYFSTEDPAKRWNNARKGFHDQPFDRPATGDYVLDAVRRLYAPEDFDDPVFQEEFVRFSEPLFRWRQKYE